MASAITEHKQSALVADADDDGVSDYGESLATDTTSLRSSLFQYEYENGRRFHRTGTDKDYFVPNDEQEQDRLDLHHHLCALLLLDGGLHTTKFTTPPHRVLDLGTGTGIWALDFAETQPSAQVLGVDQTPIQPSWILPNCAFEIDDIEQPWTWPRNHFDFIHSRTMMLAIRDWPRYIAQMFAHCTPGGHVELVETGSTLYSDDNTAPDDSGVATVVRLWNQSATKAGLNAHDGKALAGLLIDAGFVNVSITTVKQPWSGWAKDAKMKKIGRVMSLLNEASIKAYSLALFTRILGMSVEDVDAVCDRANADVRNRKMHFYTNAYFVSARKPKETEAEEA
ncbi:S-adenosyl-L-methionine-dependent methyltransferase [Geopyxis carbonaria]|nr:S-adenosyl-L-methionine-dependent methyltransferase [Geopyxis carbonaria]